MNRREFMLHSAAITAASRSGLTEASGQQQGAATETSLPESGDAAADRGFWSYYPSDDFGAPYLRRRWFIHDTQASVAEGRVLLKNANTTTGAILLKGCYDNRTAGGEGGKPKVYLSWPWAMEAQIIIAQLPHPETPFCGRIGLTLSNAQGMQAPVEIGRAGGFGANWVYYRVDKKRDDDWIQDIAVNRASNLLMRIEGVGEDRRSVRCGIKLREQDDWHWSPAHQLDQESRWAEGVGLFNARTAGLKSLETTGDAVTIAFDYVRFAGKCFTLTAESARIHQCSARFARGR